MPIFRGVDRAVGTADTAWGLPGSVPRKQVVNAVRVDLTVGGWSAHPAMGPQPP